MYPYVVCYCGRSLGDLYDLFCAMRLSKYAEIYPETGGIDPSLLATAEDGRVELGDVLDALGLHLDCCRVRMITQVEYKELY